MTIACEVEIKVPPRELWALLDDDTKLPLWMPDILATTYPDGHDKARPVGTRFRQTIREGRGHKEYDGEVTAYEPERLLSIRLSDARFTADVGYRLTPLDNGRAVRLDYTCATNVRGAFFKLIMTAARPMMRRLVARHLASLKRLAETGVPAQQRPGQASRREQAT